MSAAPSLAWDPSLTGIRGIAIALVVAAHLGLAMPHGGLVGVTTFFVLSGFLITSLLLAEIDATGRVDLKAFAMRRVRRLIPALFVCAGIVALVATAAGQAAAIWMDTLLALSYLSNWARADGDLVGMWNHAWSLAIEGQFYLAWPPILLLVTRRWRPSRRRWAAILFIAAGVSAAWRTGLDLSGVSGERLYFGTDTRCEALLAGCALAFLPAGPRAVHAPRSLGAAALVGLIGLSVLGPVDRPWQNAVYSVAVVATCVLIATVRTPGSSWGLASRPMVWLGERSYSLYLWHVPVQLTVLGLIGTAATPDVTAVSAAVSMGLAACSYTLVEQPFRSRQPSPVLLPIPGRSADTDVELGAPAMVPAAPS